MKTILILLGAIFLSKATYASSGQAYLDRFMAYYNWSQNLPKQPDNEFLTFIDEDTPLAQKLREKWLYQLAQQKDWTTYSQHYKNSADGNLQCFAAFADYSLGYIDKALTSAKKIWLTGVSSPPACNRLLDILLNSENFDERLISERIKLALDNHNVSLARYLLKRFKIPRKGDEQLLMMIHEKPTNISTLKAGDLHDVFYLYGLKRLLLTNMNQAIKYWQSPQTKRLLSTAENQDFIAHVALYKAMRNQEDASLWFNKVKPAYYNDILLDWQIRLALKQLNWPLVKNLINNYHDKENPCWQYWLARAYEQTNQEEKSDKIYQDLAKTRHYYGFLASLRLNKKFSFLNEKSINDKKLLNPYQPFTDNIKYLYYNKQTLQASRLLNDFVLELPKEDKSALISWVANDLQWHGKSVYLSNSAEELSNQLALRFPLPYIDSVNKYSKNYLIPPELIYAIIRQESGFRDDVVSSAGALGLMQVMPTTAKVVAKSEKISFNDKIQLFSSQKNINIGVAYLKYLAKHFTMNPILMAAAYNAGPRQVNYWLKNHPPKEIDIWIETLPWRETRNYLKNVISFYAVYQYRLQHKSDVGAIMQSL